MSKEVSKIGKYLFVSLVMCLMTVFSFAASGFAATNADLYNKLISGDTQQTALVLARITDVEQGMDAEADVSVIRCINGSIDTFNASINNIDNTLNEYQTGDTVVMSLYKPFIGDYEVSLFMKKVKVLDSGIVEFAFDEYTPDLFALEWYINSGQKDFVFKPGKNDKGIKVYVKDDTHEYINDDNKIAVDIDDVGKTLIYSQDKDGKVSVNRLEKPFLTESNNVFINEKFYIKYRTELIIGCIVLIVILLSVWYPLNKWAKKGKNKSGYNYLEEQKNIPDSESDNMEE